MRTIFDKRTGQTLADVIVNRASYVATDIDNLGEYGTVEITCGWTGDQMTVACFRNDRDFWFKIDGAYRAAA